MFRWHLHYPPFSSVRDLLTTELSTPILTVLRCWDGKNLDSPDHQSHMYNTVTSDYFVNAPACPSSHPVRVPQVTFETVWYVHIGAGVFHHGVVPKSYY